MHLLEGAVEKAAAVKPEIRFVSYLSSIRRLATLPVPLDVKTLKKCIAFEKFSWVLLTTTGSQIYCFSFCFLNINYYAVRMYFSRSVCVCVCVCMYDCTLSYLVREGIGKNCRGGERGKIGDLIGQKQRRVKNGR